MARRPLKNDIPAKTKPGNSGIFQAQPRPEKPSYPKSHKMVGDNPRGLTTNRQKPGGGVGSAGPTTDVDY